MSYYDENGTDAFMETDTFDSTDDLIEADISDSTDADVQQTNENVSQSREKNRKKPKKISAVIAALVAAAFLIIRIFLVIVVRSDVPKSKPKFADGIPYVTMPEIPKISIPKIKITIPDAKINDDIQKALEHDLNIAGIQNGVWQEGTYKAGEDIPFGTYLLMSDNETAFTVGFYPNEDRKPEENLIEEPASCFSRYITLNTDGYLEIQGAKLYDIQKSNAVNDPHEHSGMFLVGRDIEPGTYELVREASVETETSDASYRIYPDAVVARTVIKEQGEYKDSIMITIREGEFLELKNCIISE